MKRICIQDKNISYIAAIHTNNINALKTCLENDKKLTSEDLAIAFYDAISDKPIENVSPETLRMLAYYDALPKGVTLSTLKFVLHTIGHDRIDIEETLKANDVNFNGCEGLPHPMTIAAKRGVVDLVEFLIPRTDERPIDECFVFLQADNIPDALELPYVKDTKNKVISRTDIINKCKVMKLFIESPTFEVYKLITELKSNYQNISPITNFFSWLAKNNDCSLFSFEAFREYVKNFPDDFNLTKYTAAKSSSKEFIKHAIESNLYTVESIKQILNTAIANKNPELINSIALCCEHKKISLEEESKCHNNRMYQAIINSSVECMKALIECKLNYLIASGAESSLWASIKVGEQNNNCTRYILSFNVVDIEQLHTTRLGTITPLHYACIRHQYSTALILVLSGANTKVLSHEEQAKLDVRFSKAIETFLFEPASSSAFISAFFNSSENPKFYICSDLVRHISSYLGSEDLLRLTLVSKTTKIVFKQLLMDYIVDSPKAVGAMDCNQQYFPPRNQSGSLVSTNNY